MVKLVYLDTCILMDYFLDRRGSDVAWDILSRSLNCEFKLVLSDWLLCELEQHVPSAGLKGFFGLFRSKDKFVLVRHTPEEVVQAKAISDHFQDPLHALLAKKAGADLLVTANIQHFASCRDLVKAVFPEDV
ncbi:MAG: type II toxin-antitoxin system VapC family toxin [Candidatus Altiarchaeota archaeon]